MVRIAEAEDVAMVGDGSRAHLPSPSYFPILLAFGLPVIGYGLIFNMTLCVVGGAMVIAGFAGWAMEPSDDPELPSHGGGDGAGPDGDGAGDAATPDEPRASALEEGVTVGD
jgi:cytochrome c oxidase subunit 1